MDISVAAPELFLIVKFLFQNGSSFLIRNQAQFSRELLPLYYKHNNLASFIRQLNMYGFHKITSVESGGLKVDKDEMEFAHTYFLRGHPYLLENIKRKIPTGGVSSGSSSHSPTGNVKPEIVSRVLQDVRQMKGRQETLDSRFNAMKRENEALWRELALLRQKHMKQQQIVNKLIQFLVTLVQPNRGLGIKRTYPLMLNDTPNRNTHSNSRHGVSQPKVAKINVISDVMAHEELSPKGPVIHELDNNVEYILPDDSYDDDLSGVEFVCGRDEEVEGDKLAAYTGTNVPMGALKSENGQRNQGQPVSPVAGAEASDIPVQQNKDNLLLAICSLSSVQGKCLDPSTYFDWSGKFSCIPRRDIRVKIIKLQKLHFLSNLLYSAILSTVFFNNPSCIKFPIQFLDSLLVVSIYIVSSFICCST
ncbi:hypothetical protein J437_LFUL004694 [Ladona fulva]|uniref:HSF-type DNA-binding domain-containing protein n=1 Tax=Ladona fulva TaxID=123851 RepID=A0A8K0KRL9_LADFU|nr:hypothetical protein J437_LFUL004694 [Ladona fulva]